MKDYLALGPVPAEEECAQVGSENYEARAQKECYRFIDCIKKKFGPPPPNTSLSIKRFPHDFGYYQEVVVFYETTDQKSADYAYGVEANAPSRWPSSPRKRKKKTYGLVDLLEEYHVSLETLLEQGAFDGTCLGICIKCGYTTETEPDQDEGWCENCKTNTVKSGMILAGII